MSERDRHSKRRFRDDPPDPDDRYDPKQGAKRSKRDEEGSEPGATARSQRELPDFSDRYEPQAGRPDSTRSRSKERPPHSSREHRDHTSSREHRDSSRSHRSSRHHSPERASGDRIADRPRHSDSRGPDASEPHSPRQALDQKGDSTDNRLSSWQAPDFGGRGPGMSDRGGFGRGNFIPGRGMGRGRGQFDNFQGRGSGNSDWNENQDGMPDGGRGGRAGFIPRGRFGRFGGRFEGAGGRMEGRFDSFRGRGAFPFRGRGGRGFVPNDMGGPVPFSRGQDGPMEGGPGRGFAPGRGGFPPGGRGPPPPFQRRPPNVDPVVAERRKESSEKHLRQQVSQLHIASDLVPERLNDKHQLLLKSDSQDKGASNVASTQTASAYFYAALNSDQPLIASQGTGGADRAAFDAALELYQRPQVAQWTRTSSHGTFTLTSTQVMASV